MKTILSVNVMKISNNIIYNIIEISREENKHTNVLQIL